MNSLKQMHTWDKQRMSYIRCEAQNNPAAEDYSIVGSGWKLGIVSSHV